MVFQGESNHRGAIEFGVLVCQAASAGGGVSDRDAAVGSAGNAPVPLLLLAFPLLVRLKDFTSSSRSTSPLCIGTLDPARKLRGMAAF